DTGRREPVTVSFSILSCAYAAGAARPTTTPALTACATASDSFFLCILFIMDPHGVDGATTLVVTTHPFRSTADWHRHTSNKSANALANAMQQTVDRRCVIASRPKQRRAGFAQSKTARVARRRQR